MRIVPPGAKFTRSVVVFWGGSLSAPAPDGGSVIPRSVSGTTINASWNFISLGRGLIRRITLQPPPPRRYAGPNGLDQAKRPRTLQEAVGRTQQARTGEGENEPLAAFFQRIENQHGGYGE